MVYNTQNYWIFGFCPSSGILKTREHNVSETGSVSVLRKGETPTLLGPLERANLNHWSGEYVSPPLIEDVNRSSFRNVFFSNF
jgi:hypothetical protein